MTMVVSPIRRPQTPGVDPVPLDDLARRFAELWSLEPQVPRRRRSELLGELDALESELDSLLLRAAADVEPSRVRTCAQRYLWLRQQWGDHGMAA